MSISAKIFLALVVSLSACAPAPRPSSAGGDGARAPELYLDHVPIAVHSLDAATQTYGERLGFRIKPGRPHANGIRNAFAKFPDGSYLELITAREATDDLSRGYTEFLERQEGGRFLALRADSLPAVAARFEAHGHASTLNRYGPAFSILSLADFALKHVFLIEYPEPVRDSARLLQHPNTALGLETVWMPRRRFEALARVPSVFRVSADGSAISLARGVIALSDETTGGSVAGVTVRVRSIDAAREAVRRGTGEELPIREDARGRSIRVSARLAHGVWIEFVERPG